MKGLQKLICGFLAFAMMFVILPVPAYAENGEVCAEDAHVWGEGVRTEATEDAPAFLTYTCSICGQTKVEEEAPAELPCEHSWDEGVSSETVIMYTCTLCGETKTEELPVVEEPTHCAENVHVWDDGVSSKTVITYTCTVCGETKTENVQQPQPMVEEPVEGITIDAANFPDENFRSYVSQFDIDADGMLNKTELASVTKIDVEGKEISSLDGVEYFANLDSLYCGWNKLPCLNLDSNQAVLYFNCDWNKYTFDLKSGNAVDLAKLPGKFDVSRASNWSAGTINGTMLELDATEQCSTEVTYSYDVDGTGRLFTFTLAINRPHTPGDKITANYTECGGGWTVDCYTCSVCYTVCDEYGQTVQDAYKEGTGKHKPDPNRIQGADYTECGGGWMVPFTCCEACGNLCSLSGGVLNFDVDYRSGNNQHTPDIAKKQKADYTQCGGGCTVDWYPCKNCGQSCLGNGSPLTGEYYQEGTNQHTPDTSEKQKANYTECHGGWTVDSYTCEICHRSCLSDGTELDYEKYYKPGNGKHTPNLSQVHKASYTECGGGYTVDYYSCKDCHSPCLFDGAELDYEQYYKDGNGQHKVNLYRKQAADYNECSGGWIIDRYWCDVCNQMCTIDGKEADFEKYYREGTGKHTPDTTQKIEPDYTECGGGWIVTRYSCKNCRRDCLLDGIEPDRYAYYKEGNGHHTADLERKIEADFTECGGGLVVDHYLCKVCNRSCILDGSPLDYENQYKDGNGKHTPGPEKQPTYMECSGGIVVPYHECIYCNSFCDANGEAFSDSIFESGNGKHTPGTIFVPSEAQCGPRINVPYGICIYCGSACREDGSGLVYPDDYFFGTTRHIPGETFKMFDTRCAGVKNEWYVIDYAYCINCGELCNPDGSEFMGELFDPHNPHFDFDEDQICDRGGEYIYAVTGGNIYLDPKTGFITDCDDLVISANIPNQILDTKIVGIKRYAFKFARGLQSVTLPEGIKEVEYNAFNGCSQLRHINFPDTLVSIGEHAFYMCGLTELVIPDGVTSLTNAVFSGCVDLKSTTIGTGVTSIGSIAFARCGQLGEIKFLGDAPSIAENAFSGVTATVYYPRSNRTWTEAVRQNYGGTLTWVAYDTTNENTLVLDEAQFGNASVLWIDGIQYRITDSDRVDGKIYLDLPDTERKILTTHTYNTGASNLHQVYPTGMKVWKLNNDGTSYTATELKEFANILQYCGSSIRMTGVKGIRMITGVPDGQRNALLSGNLAGYTLEEYGTVIGFAGEVGDNLTLENGRSNYAYKRGVSDAIFAQSGGKTQYTNVLVGFTMEQCKEDIAMRPYMKVKDSEGNVSVIYGGIVYRSIGYIAWQNRDVYPQGSDGCNYIWDIINAVYGDNQPG